ncbi:MAG: PPC domain-containing protein [Verrucomicrobiota bacterium]|nr:PPC domain-containing protein [Verrucomicrobiota bacterium]MDP7051125.1 PPC domain-containing protein [Verrucomicrobiota bacterium]
MRQIRFTVALAVVSCFFSAWPVGLAKLPAVTSIFPAGGQRGSAFELTAADAPDPWPSAAWTSHPGIQLEPLNDKKGVYKTTIASDTPVGPHLVRFHNADGASQTRIFFVGLAEETSEAEPNDKLDAAQFLENTPVVVNGRLDKSGDVDAFSFRATKGDWIVAQCHAYSLDSPVDAFLHLHDENGSKVAFAPDTQNLDPLLTWQARETGTHTLTFAGLVFPFNASARFHGSPHTVYRITISTGPFARNTYPLGVKRGVKTPVHLVGWGFEKQQAAQATMVNAAITGETSWVGAKGLSAPVPVLLGHLPGHRETEPNDSTDTALTIAWPSAVHGHISMADDEDRFGIVVAKGDQLRLRLRASEFNSTLDPVLRIEDATGKQLARDDDSGERQDARLDWTAPADGTYHLAVSDLIRSGGPSHFYRLEIDRITPSLNATFTPPRLVVEAGKSVEAIVSIGFADGYKGKTAVVARGLPDGVSAQIPATEKGGTVKIKLVAAETAKPANVPLTLLVVEPGTPTSHTATSPIGMDKAGGDRLINAIDHLWLTVKAKPEPKKENKK